MWFRFEKGNPIGVPRIEKYQVAFYDMDNNGDCFDESFWKPDEIDKVITYVETVEDEGSGDDRSRVFAIFDNGDMYEIKLEKIDKRKQRVLSNFYGDAKAIN